MLKETNATIIKYDKLSIWDALMQKYLDLSFNEHDPQQMVKISIEQLMQISEEYHNYSLISFTEEEYADFLEQPQEVPQEPDETLSVINGEVSEKDYKIPKLTSAAPSLVTSQKETSRPTLIFSASSLEVVKEQQEPDLIPNIPGKQPRKLQRPIKEEEAMSKAS